MTDGRSGTGSSGTRRRRLVLATANPDKAREIEAVLADWELLPRPATVPDVEETEPTLEGNARLKARAVSAATGQPALADDTGLEVDALGGAPGVFSARFAGEGATYADNVAKLLAELGDRPDRRARFRTVAMVAFPDGSEVLAEGAVDGVIAAEPKGTSGFGYDPVFVPDGSGGLTFAEMGAEAKNAMSHRGRAMRALARALGQLPVTTT
ncbi:MAG TPA: RdgB/HAM1 family non-canonical purine NTP pyrophosphatase [Acidimicrobiales bacterium]|nr:RdgB/HAM1 family non-canonical purine NTP pyrophosphatase [Acidimicrobiales bacterium]